MKKQISFYVATGLLASTALAPAAFAQDEAAEADEVTSVYERYRPDYDAPGIRSGSFLFYPTIAAEGKYDSNIYAQESGVTDDFIALIKPSFALVSDWNTDFLQVFADANIARYTDNSSEDWEDFNIGASGRKDISHGTDIHADIMYQDGHEDRGSADAVGNQVAPAQTSTFRASLGFKRDVSILSVALDGRYVKQNFDDVALQGGGTLNNDDRDRDRVTVEGRVGYELADGREAFIRGSIDRVEYDNSKEDGGPQRNSDGMEIVGGAAFDLTGKARGEVYGGYMKRTFDSETMGEIDGFKFGAELLWNVSGLTSFTGSIKRSIDETSVFGENENGVAIPASGIISTLVFGRVEHELRRNVLLNAQGSFTKQSFALTTREDDLINFGVGAKYLLNPNVNVNVGYDYSYRDTNVQGQDYSRHALMVNVKAQW
ncbi:outer membrane beta-barrel protein [Kordiimonas lipolytica]|uniref:Outer membrane beta-barrel protein n=1 Tax=Kordiimonas lipolytica TaxID=1662421 RepID=A0ABV8UCI7_9PROT|nr:outer membrane beta-barrel protein [Kordiimonas lipolytica]